MNYFKQEISKQTKSLYDFIDITEEIIKIVQDSKIENGLANIQIMHTSAALIVNENEPLLLEDFKDNLEKVATRSQFYHHDDMTHRTVNVCDNECVNGHAHCKAIHLLPNATLNIWEGKLQLGQWQRVFLVELDRSRPRTVQIMVLGE